MDEVFDFVECATSEPVLFNIETKINPDFRNETRGPAEFVAAFVKVLEGRPGLIDRVTHQSFDWRALIESKRVIPQLRTSALVSICNCCARTRKLVSMAEPRRHSQCDDTTLWKYPDGETTGNLTTHGDGPGNWLAGINIDDPKFPGSTPQERVAQAAASIKADFLSPTATAYASESDDPAMEDWIPFTTPEMVKTAHDLGLRVATWTPNRLNVVEYLVNNCEQAMRTQLRNCRAF